MEQAAAEALPEPICTFPNIGCQPRIGDYCCAVLEHGTLDTSKVVQHDLCGDAAAGPTELRFDTGFPDRGGTPVDLLITPKGEFNCTFGKASKPEGGTHTDGVSGQFGVIAVPVGSGAEFVKQRTYDRAYVKTTFSFVDIDQEREVGRRNVSRSVRKSIRCRMALPPAIRNLSKM